MVSRLKDFHDRFGSGEDCERPSPEEIERWRGDIDDVLLSEWETHGWCAYNHRSFWLVNPSLYEGVVSEWFPDAVDKMHVFARGAFGDLLLTVSSGGIRHLYVHYGKYVDMGKTASLRSFFNLALDEKFAKVALNGALAAKAAKKLGPVAVDEMFTFEPALALGGAEELKFVKKVKMMPQLSFLAQLHDAVVEVKSPY